MYIFYILLLLISYFTPCKELWCTWWEPNSYRGQHYRTSNRVYVVVKPYKMSCETDMLLNCYTNQGEATRVSSKIKNTSWKIFLFNFFLLITRILCNCLLGLVLTTCGSQHCMNESVHTLVLSNVIKTLYSVMDVVSIWLAYVPQSVHDDVTNRLVERLTE